jgi:tRNA (mo5U34)-methyltransferase
MIALDFHKRIPLIRRPFYQRDQARRELAEAQVRLAEMDRELSEARSIISAKQLPGSNSNSFEADHRPASAPQQPEAEQTVESELQRRINAIRWYHEFDFPNGLKASTTGENEPSHRALWSFMKDQLDHIDFAGRSVLDIGCWDGYWSFYAERRGAARVLATDDATQNWAGRAGLDLAKEILESSVETRTDVSVYDLKQLRGKFDVILFMGVYYHLIDPFYALAEIRHLCHKDSLVILEGDFMPDGRLGSSTAAFYDIGHGSRCFVPTLGCLRQMVQAAYLEIVSEATHHGLPEQPVDRLFLVCRAVNAANPLHPYRPPFELHRYDPRWVSD